MTETFNKKRINLAELSRLKKRLRESGLHTVCESALCPNIGECFHKGNATFLIAGDVCTRGCRFCAVNKGKPLPLDPGEPARVAAMVRELGLAYAVITSVTRDDLPDGGAGHYARTVECLRRSVPVVKVEVLVPDFAGDHAAADTVFACRPDVLSHNLETVPSLYPSVRAGADYSRSLALLARAKEKGLTVKSGLMLGLGETEDEVRSVMDDLHRAGCDILTLGQYLAPTKAHYPVRAFVCAGTFRALREAALEKGFRHCASAPYVRSSYLADSMLE